MATHNGENEEVERRNIPCQESQRLPIVEEGGDRPQSDGDLSERSSPRICSVTRPLEYTIR